MDKWMDIKEIEQLILALRKREYNDENNKEVKQNITLALEKIDSLKQECLQKIQYSKSKGIESILYLLKTEAEIINVIGVVTYSDFSDQQTLAAYLERESEYTYREYIEDIQYYAKDFQNIEILPQFYIKTVSNTEN